MAQEEVKGAYQESEEEGCSTGAKIQEGEDHDDWDIDSEEEVEETHRVWPPGSWWSGAAHNLVLTLFQADHRLHPIQRSIQEWKYIQFEWNTQIKQERSDHLDSALAKSGDDDSVDGNAGVEYQELIDLHDDTRLSTEELRKRYYGSGDSKNEWGINSAADNKRLKGTKTDTVFQRKDADDDDDDDDDAYGF